MTIYIEYVLINNLLIDYILLKATFSTTGVLLGKKRVFFCALLSAIFSLIYPLITAPLLVITIIKFSFGLFIVYLSARHINLKSYLINTVVFFFYTFLYGGAVLGIFSLFNIPIGKEIVSALIIFPVYMIYYCTKKFVLFLYRAKHVRCFCYSTQITICGTTKCLKGFLDTGNGVYDGNSPVIFCHKSIATEFIKSIKIPQMKYINVCTITGSSQKLSIKSDKFVIYINGKKNIHTNVTVCFSEQGFENGYQLILHPALLKESYAEDSAFQTEKTA